MALTADEKTRIAKRYVRRVFRDLQETANVDADDIRAAGEALVENVVRNTTPAAPTNFKTWANQQLPQPFKGAATPAQKAELFAIAALFDAGLV